MAATDLPHGWTWEDVLTRLGKYVDLEASAREHEAIVRRRVIRTGSQLLRLVLAYTLSGLSLRGTAAWAEASGQASLSDVALLKRSLIRPRAVGRLATHIVTSFPDMAFVPRY